MIQEDRTFHIAHGQSGADISYSMLMSCLSSYEVLHTPDKATPSFKWVSSMRWIEVESSFPYEETLFVCRPQASKELHDKHPRAFILVATEDIIPDWIEEAPENGIVIRCGNQEALLQRIQSFFLTIRTWQSDIEHLLLTKAHLSRILTLSYPILETPLFVVDPERGVYAESDQTVGKWPEECAALATELVEEQIAGTVSVRDNRQEKYVCYFDRLYPNGPKPVFVFALCKDEDASDSKYDSFKLLVHALQIKYGRFGEAQSKFDNNKSLFPGGLISGKYLNNSRTLDEFAVYGIRPDSEFRLLATELANLDETSTRRIVATIERAFADMGLVAVCDSDVLILLHSEHSDARLSNSRLRQFITEQIYTPYNVCTVASQVFEDIRNTKYAYQQTRYVMKYRHFVDAENQFMLADVPTKSFYTFEECFTFMLVDSETMSTELRDFSLSHTILDKLIAEDKKSGTNNARILTMYAFYGRNATVVAEKLHMHRNTVLYHINKIQERFDFNLDDNGIMDRLLLDVKALNARLAHSPISLTEIKNSPLEALRHL